MPISPSSPDALRIIRLYGQRPVNDVSDVICRQLLRSGTSAGAHHREAHHARSDAEFVSKMEVGIQELEESAYWLDLLAEAHVIPADRLRPLQDETRELMAIMTASVKTVKLRTKS